MVISKLKNFISIHPYALLVFTCCISYGQMLAMYIWKDDNAIFFKFSHLAEPAGYLGRGLLGEGPYRLSVAPYWFIYKLFSKNTLVPYYALALGFYILAAISIYKLFEVMISRKVAFVTALLFSFGYIGSEGFYWLASSWILSMSIILTSYAIKSYFTFTTEPSKSSYLRSLIWYILCIEVTPVRTHYVIALIIAIEFLWGITQVSKKVLFRSIYRLSPFIIAFCLLYLVNADSRTASLSTYFFALRSKNWFEFYSFFATAGNIFLTDIQSKFVFSVLKPILSLHIGSFMFKTTVIFISALFIHSVAHPRKLLMTVYFLLAIAWTFFLKLLITSPQITFFDNYQYLLFLSGIVLLTLFFTSFFKKWRIHFFLLIWFCISLSVYTSYIPTGFYASIDRYVAHSFIPFIGLLALYSTQKRSSKMIIILIGVWGVTNLYSNIVSQRAIILNRSIPAKNFYKELKAELPEIKKGDVVYIDVSENERTHYAGAFSVGQMPETTALAWRYGIDRYDFRLVNQFSEIVLPEEATKQQPSSIHSFFYNNGHVANTTEDYYKLQNVHLSNIPFDELVSGSDSTLTFKQQVSSVRPQKIVLHIKATVHDARSISFPYGDPTKVKKDLISNKQFRNAAYQYQKYLEDFYKEASINATSSWQGRDAHNLIDNNTDTVWQPDRILWHDQQQSFTIDFKKTQTINRLVWKNGFENNSPTSYTLQYSLDGNSYMTLKHIAEIGRIAPDKSNYINFDPTEMRYIRIVFHNSLNDDAPGISEVLPISTIFMNYDISDFDVFLKNPFVYVKDMPTYSELVSHFISSPIKVSWLKNDSDQFKSTQLSFINVNFDAKEYKYTVVLPAGGTNLKQLRLMSGTIPGEINISRVDISYE